MTYKTIGVAGDHHFPFVDWVADKLIKNLWLDIKVDKIILLGDFLDFWQISKFAKNPDRINTLQDDLDKANDYLTELRDLFPKTDIIFITGNHEERLLKYLWQQAPELSPLRNCQFENLLDFKSLKIKFYPRANDVHREEDLLFTHGTVVRQDSAMTARCMLKKYGMSVIMGHTHRLGSYYETKMGGAMGAYENGCMCMPSLAKDWRMGFPNWQTGTSIVHIVKNRFQVHQLPILKNKVFFGGRLYI